MPATRHQKVKAESDEIYPYDVSKSPNRTRAKTEPLEPLEPLVPSIEQPLSQDQDSSQDISQDSIFDSQESKDSQDTIISVPPPPARDEIPNCYCRPNRKAVPLFCSKRPEWNIGKYYYKCAHAEDDQGCQFERWIESPEEASARIARLKEEDKRLGRPAFAQPPPAISRYVCFCGENCRRFVTYLRTRALAQNIGRAFYQCSWLKCRYYRFADGYIPINALNDQAQLGIFKCCRDCQTEYGEIWYVSVKVGANFSGKIATWTISPSKEQIKGERV
jgi:hypothetical protein